MWVLGDEVLGLRVLKKCHKVLKFKFKFYGVIARLEMQQLKRRTCDLPLVRFWVLR